ncbi:MAG: hypothetical protein QM589_06205 [Thermomicrobiales bacterium]
MASDAVDGPDELPTIGATGVPTGTVAPTMVSTEPAEPTQVPTEEPSSDLVPVHVAVWLCGDAKCPEPVQIVAGVLVGAVETGSGQLLAECLTTDDAAGCSFSVPAGTDWTLRWDESAIPAGYVFDSVSTVTGGGWEGEAYILQFVPVPEEPQVETVHAGVMLCDDARCTDGELLAGIGVASVDTGTNAQVDNCETAGDPAVCAIDVPLYAPWSLTWDSTAIPDGYRYIGELAVVDGGAYPVLYLIRLVPDDVPTVVPTVSPSPTKVPVSGLPKTGAGDNTPGAGLGAGAAMLAVSAFGLAGLGAVAMRRRVS